MSDNVVEIRITGAVDPSLAASASEAGGTFGALGDLSAVATAAMRDGTKAVDGDVAKLISAMFDLGGGFVSAGVKAASGMRTAEDDARGLGSAAEASGSAVASGLKTAEDATHRLNFATAGAIQGYIRLGQQALSGDFASMAGTLVNLAGETGVLNMAVTAMGAEAAIATGGLAILAAGLGYIAYQEYQAEQNLESLTEAFALSGRGAIDTKEAVAAELDQLNQMPHVTGDIAEGILRWDAAHGEIDDRIASSVNQLAPQYAQAWGDKAPQALGVLKSALQQIASGSVPQAAAAFDELNAKLLKISPEGLNSLKPAQQEIIARMIAAGHQTEAWNQILADVATNGGGHIESFRARVASAEKEIKDTTAELAMLNREAGQPMEFSAYQGISLAIGFAEDKLAKYQATLHKLKAESAAPAPPPVSAQAIADELQKIAQDTTKTDAQKLAAEISYLKQRQAAHNNAAEALVYVDKTLGDKQIEQTRKTSADIIQHERDIAAASGKTGEARVNEDIKADRRILEYTKLTAQDRFDVQRDLNSKLGELHGQQAAAAINADNETRERTLRSLQKQAQDFRQGTQERVDADQKWLKYAVKAFGQYSDEAEAANDAVVADQRAHTHQLIDDSARLSENRVKDINETADEAVKALDQERKYFNLTADTEIAAAKRIEDERDKNANQALSDALKAANGEQDIVSRVDKEIEEERRKHQKRLSDIARQGLDEQVQDWSRFNQRITSAEDELVGDIFQGDKSLWQNLRDVGLRFLEQMIADDVKFWTEREFLALEGVKAENAAEHGGFTDFIRLLTQRTTAATAAQGTQTSVTVTGQAVQTAATASGTATREAIGQSENSSFLGRVFSEIAQWLGLESAKTAATTAGAEARVTAEETARAQGKAAELASGSAEILNDAYKAAAGAYNAVVGIPVIGPVLAPIAAGVAFAAVSAYDQLTSAEGGLERVDSAEKLMITHRDESVLPARISRPLMSFVGALPAMAELVKQNSAPAFDPRTSAPDPSNSVSAVVARAGSPDLRSIADVGSLLPVTSPSASVHAALRAQSPQSDADYVASQVGGGGRASASSSPASSKNRGGDIHIHAWDASSMNQFFRKPSNRRTMDQISKDRVRAGFLPG